MKKTIKWIGYIICFLLVCVLAYRIYPSSPTSDNAVRWLKGSGLIAQNAKVTTEYGFKPFSKKISIENEGIVIIEYLYNHEEYMKNKSRKTIYLGFVTTIYNKNLEVEVYDTRETYRGKIYDVIHAKKPLPQILKTKP